jgi:hypothetical protein
MLIKYSVSRGSTFISIVEHEWETEQYFCHRRKDGSLSKHQKHPVGTSISYYDTREAAWQMILAYAASDLDRAKESVLHREKTLAWLKTLPLDGSGVV